MKQLWISLKILFIFTVLTGVVYPLLVTGIGNIFFPRQSGGSLFREQNQIIGSELIGQTFEKPSYFWPRPSAIDYQPIPSGGSNLASTSDELKKQVEERKIKFGSDAPQDLLFASASGLDPHISPEAALAQVGRVAVARGLSNAQIKKLMETMIEKRTFGFLGEERVNVLQLNIELDKQ